MTIAILDIDNLNNPHWGSGQALVTQEVGKRLAKDHKITVFCSKYPKYKDYEKNGITYKHIGLGTNKATINNMGYISSLPFTVLNVKADIILENFTAPISTCFSPLFTKTHVVGISSFFAAEQMTKKYKLKFDSIEKFGCKFYKYFIALNKEHQDKIKKINPNIVSRVIANGIDEVYFKLQTREENYILFFGRIDLHQKGLDLLVKAYSKAAKRIKEKLYIMGKGDPENENKLKYLIKKNKMEGRIIILGKQLGKVKYKVMTGAKFMVFPSRYEGQSLSALESLALGKPIICTNISGFNWLDKKSCVKTKPDNIQDLSDKLLYLVNSKKERKNLSQLSKKVAANFSWDKTAFAYEKFLSEIVEK